MLRRPLFQHEILVGWNVALHHLLTKKSLLVLQGKYAEAEPLFDRSQAIRTTMYLPRRFSNYMRILPWRLGWMGGAGGGDEVVSLIRTRS